MENKQLEALLIEDNDEFAGAAKEVLESKGYLVNRVSNFQDAKKEIHGKDYDAYFIDGIFPYSANQSEEGYYQDQETAREFEGIYNRMADKKYKLKREIPSEVLFPMFDGFVFEMMPYGALIAQKLKQAGKKYILSSQGSWHGDYMGIWGENAANELELKSHFAKEKATKEYWEKVYKKLAGGEDGK